MSLWTGKLTVPSFSAGAESVKATGICGKNRDLELGVLCCPSSVLDQLGDLEPVTLLLWICFPSTMERAKTNLRNVTGILYVTAEHMQ